MRGRRAILTSWLGIVCAYMLLAASTTLAAGTGWAVTATAYPTALAPGGRGTVEIDLFNTGAATTEGPITVTDRLPAGVVADGEAGATSGFTRVWNCKGNGGAPGEELLVGATEVTCTNGPRLASFAGGLGVSLHGPESVGEIVAPGIAIGIEAQTTPGTFTNRVDVAGGGSLPASTTNPLNVGAHSPSFGFVDWDTWFTNAAGATDVQAGSHPYEWTTSLDLATLVSEGHLITAGGEPRGFFVELPPGLIGNPQAIPSCTRPEFVTLSCPKASEVGLVVARFAQFGAAPPFDFGGGPAEVEVFNLAAPKGSPAELAFELNGITGYIDPSLRTGGDYGLDAAARPVPQREVTGVELTIWGTPAAASHDRWRGGNGAACTVGQVEAHDCSGELDPRVEKPFLTMPTSCGAPPRFAIRANLWGGSPLEAADEVAMHDSEGDPVGLEGCAREPFSPTISARPTTDVSDSPSGLEVDLHLPDTGLEDPAAETSEADLKRATVTLPEGMTVNPSGANGLGACTPSQVGLTSAIGQTPVTMTAAPAECPNDAKLGSVTVDTPLLDHPLEGAVYIATPQQNPFGSLLALYIAVDDEASGTVLKLPGKVEADPVTGRLTATFDENPQLPFADFRLHFFDGAGAALRTPPTCGEYTTTSTMTPWSTPEGADSHPSDSFLIDRSPRGGECPTSAAALPNAPAFEAGTVMPKGGIYSPFVLHLSRADGTQEISRIQTTLPEGLLAKLAGVTECSDAQVAQAESRGGLGEGAIEQAHPSCPPSSEVGTVDVGAGAGITPYYASGHAYLGGSYQGAPLSLVIITPAVAGPFDLGTVVVHTALRVDPLTAQVQAESDPIPHIVHGIPLDVRSISLELARNQFTLNPTSCQMEAIAGAATSPLGSSASLTAPFQVGECGALAFKPKLSLALTGSTKRAGHPALKAVLTYPKGGGYANIARAQVNLPSSEFIDQGNLNKVCTRPVLLEGRCPATTIYGKAEAWTPLLEKPLAGPVYLVGGFGYKLPALVAELNGQIRVLLVGKVDSGKNKGIRNTFEAVPDAPVEKFVLEMKGGPKYSLLENSEPLCPKKQKAGAVFEAQNGKVLNASVPIRVRCSEKTEKRRSSGGNHRHGH